jgi:phosphatidylinositol glycan class B
LTITALYNWPWEILGDALESKQVALQRSSSVNRLRLSLVLAAIAVLLRPTNILVWLAVTTLTLTRFTLDGETPLRRSSLLVLIREIALCGAAVLAGSVLSDRLYFGFWTFPPYKWLYFNLSQDLAVFYGQMPWHYYLSQGIPLLSTTFLPFVLIGLYKATTSPLSESILQANTIRTLSFTVLTMISSLSIISHKEVRFIYPLLPVLQVLAGPYLASFFTSPTPTISTAATNHLSSSPKTTTRTKTALRHRFFLANILSINILLATYLATFHQPAVISVTAFLRHEFERLHPESLSLPEPTQSAEELFVFFFTPCHSTPWRSHLIYPALRARALTCEPPLHTAPGSPERIDYRDEADRFYDDPVKFLGNEVMEVPRYIVGFAGVEEMLNQYLKETSEGKRTGIKLTKVWEAFNGLFNEDWRRRGKLVVWDTGVYNGERREGR